MKICSKCSEIKPESNFYVRDQKTGRLHAQCKDCYSAQRKKTYKEHYYRYRSKYLERAKRRRALQRSDFRTKMIKYLSDKSCAICNESDMRVLEFDHIDPTVKEFSISQAVRMGYSWPAVEAEIMKCRVLCANCHRKHTAKQASWYKNFK